MSQDPTQPQNGLTPLWTLGPIQDLPVLSSAGTYVEGKSVTVNFWDGSQEVLKIAKSAYSPQEVQRQAQLAAEKHLQVKALQGPPVPWEPPPPY